MSQLTVDSINGVFSLYQKYGEKGYIGETITQLEHATQAAMSAEKEEYFNFPELIISAFLHDIGHLLCYQNESLELMGNFGVKNHELIGANYLRDKGFPEIICKLVAGHVPTKRYLISKDQNYYNNLSEASKETFKRQGGNMTQSEIDLFEEDPLFILHLKMRHYDDMAKLNDNQTLENIKKMDPVEYFRVYTMKHLLDFE